MYFDGAGEAIGLDDDTPMYFDGGGEALGFDTIYLTGVGLLVIFLIGAGLGLL